MKTKAAFITKTGSPESIQWGEIDLPELKQSDVLVKVKAAAVNPVDTYIRSGKFPMQIPNPYLLGSDFIGEVEKTGAKSRFKKGQLVWSNSAGKNGRLGCYAEYVVIEEKLLYAAPAKLDPLQVVAVAQSGPTACRGLIQGAQLHANEIIFVNGGGGNVGSSVIQLAVALGARVFASTTGQDKIEWCKSLGAEHVIDYKSDNVEEAIRKKAPQGVQVYWDTSKDPHFDLAVKVLAPHGRLVLMAGAESKPTFPVGAFYRNELSLKGFSLFFATPEELEGYAEIVNRCLTENRLKSKIAKVFPLAEAAKAHQLLEKEKELWGKVILTAN